MADRFNHLLDQVEDGDLRQKLADAYRQAASGAPYGIHFNPNHLEEIRLHGRAITVGSTVAYRNFRWKKAKETAKGIFESNQVGEQKYLVQGVSEDVATVVPVGGKAELVEIEIPVSDLVVLKIPGEPIFPILNPIGSIIHAPKKRSHVVIEGENYSALQLLQFTHREQVDTIYIDPPYNTGNKEWTYNDSYVTDEDSYRHSKWLAFMERRLRLAKSLLKETGVILISIDDNEYAQLKLLCDRRSLFGEDNFIAPLIWKRGRKNDSKFLSNGHEYMLVYAKNKQALIEADVKWREKKGGVDVLLAAYEALKTEHGDDYAAIKAGVAAWLKKNGKSVEKGLRLYKEVDERGLYMSADLSAPDRPETRSHRPLIHPVMGKPCAVSPRGWALTDETMDQRLSDGLIHFGPDETTVPRAKKYLEDMPTSVAETVFETDGAAAVKQLAQILGEKRFPFPKDAHVIARFIDLVTPDDGIVLDFFGGSGTTMQSVAAVNEVSGKTRQCILVTANELEEKEQKELSKQDFAIGNTEWDECGLFYRVTKPRIEAIFTGKREDGSELPEGLVHKSVDGGLTRPMAKGFDQNVEFFSIGYTDKASLTISTTRRFQQVLPTLWLMSGAYGTRAVSDKQKFFVGEASFAVLFKKSAIKAFANALEETQQVNTVFIVTDDEEVYGEAVHSLPNYRVFRLYRDYITTFAVNTEKE